MANPELSHRPGCYMRMMRFALGGCPASRVELEEGVEPSAYGVRNRCSAIELPQHVGGGVCQFPSRWKDEKEVVHASLER